MGCIQIDIEQELLFLGLALILSCLDERLFVLFLAILQFIRRFKGVRKGFNKESRMGRRDRSLNIPDLLLARTDCLE